MTLNPEDPRPVSQQIADVLRAEIADGTLEPKAKLDSVRQLATRFEVSTQAADKALRILKAEGLTYTNVGRGTFVRAEAANELASREHSPEFAALNARLDELFELVDSINGRLMTLEGSHAHSDSRPPQGE